jgi:hypothetical protein
MLINTSFRSRWLFVVVSNDFFLGLLHRILHRFLIRDLIVLCCLLVLLFERIRAVY